MRRLVLLTIFVLAFTLPVSGVAFADSTSDYNNKVAAAQAKVADAQSKLVSAQATLDDLRASSNGEAELLASAQTAVTTAKDNLDAVKIVHADRQSLYANSFADVQVAENAVDAAVADVNVASDLVESMYDDYVAAQTVTDSALANLTQAQQAYDASSVTTGGQATPGLTMRVYNNVQSSGHPPQRSDTLYQLCRTAVVSQIDNDWGGGSVAGCNSEYVMIHYTGYITSATARSMFFYAMADDGFYMTINGQPVINDWSLKGCGGNTVGLFNFEANRSYVIDAWFYEWSGGACATLMQQPVGSGQWSVTPAAMFSTTPVAVTTKDPALKVVVDQKMAVYVSAVAVEEQALVAYELAGAAYDTEFVAWESATDTLSAKLTVLADAESALAIAETDWQDKSDVYTDADALLTFRKSKFSVLFEQIKAQSLWVDDLALKLATAKAELAAIPKPVAPPKASKKVVSKPAPVVKVQPRAMFVPRPKL